MASEAPWDDAPSRSRSSGPAASAYRSRRRLIDALGGRCGRCGVAEAESEWALEFHHPNGRDWQPRQKNRWVRMALYWRDYRMGLLELLCKRCNVKDGVRFRWSRRSRL